jgi:hypothetical protein
MGKKMDPFNLSGIANDKLGWLAKPPVGLKTLGGVDYKILDGEHAVVHTSNLDRPHLPRGIAVDLGGATGVSRLHMLLEGNWVGNSPNGQVGLVRVRYTDGSEQKVPLVVGQTIAETWSYNDQIFAAKAFEPPVGVEWAEVWSDPQERCPRPESASCDATGFLHSLSIETDRARGLETLEILDNSPDGGIILTALTLERGR